MGSGQVSSSIGVEGVNVWTEQPVVLLADDEPRLPDFVSITLQRADYVLIVAIDGFQALEFLRAQHHE